MHAFKQKNERDANTSLVHQDIAEYLFILFHGIDNESESIYKFIRKTFHLCGSKALKCTECGFKYVLLLYVYCYWHYFYMLFFPLGDAKILMVAFAWKLNLLYGYQRLFKNCLHQANPSLLMSTVKNVVVKRAKPFPMNPYISSLRFW